MARRLLVATALSLAVGCGSSSGVTHSARTGPAVPAPPPRAASVPEPEPEGLEDAQLREVVEAKNGALRGCHALEYAGRGTSAGAMTIDLEINPDGTVASAAISDSDFQSEPLHECVLDVTRALRFPQATGPTEFSWRFKFRSSEG